MFDEAETTDQARFPSAIEILLVPGLITAVIVHAPIKVISGHAVPLGILSFDPQVVSRVRDILVEELPSYVFSGSERYDELIFALSTSTTPSPVAENLNDNVDAPTFDTDGS